MPRDLFLIMKTKKQDQEAEIALDFADLLDEQDMAISLYLDSLEE